MSAKPTAPPPLTAWQLGRSAGATIAGYQYQFERSVVETLGLGVNEKLRVEGIEDIDIWSDSPSVVQVKYYQGQRWSMSVVRSAVYELLKSSATGLQVTHVLYVHFGSGDSPPESFTLEQLKECLTYRPRGKSAVRLYEEFEEDQLFAFAGQFKIVSGVSLEEQRKITTDAIADALQCSQDEAETLHRMRAVQFLHELAVNKDESKRVITREILLGVLDDRKLFYNKWHKEVVGHERFKSGIVKKLRALSFNTSNTYRGVLLQVTDENVDAVSRLAYELAGDMNGETKRRTTAAKPWTLILRGDQASVSSVKESLISEKLPFNDGFESLRFSPELFIEPAIVKGTGSSDRLAKASHVIRVISENSMRRIPKTGHKLAQLITLMATDDWHTSIVRGRPTQIHEVNVDEITEILREVTR